jgi:hypothetical protein
VPSPKEFDRIANRLKKDPTLTVCTVTEDGMAIYGKFQIFNRRGEIVISDTSEDYRLWQLIDNTYIRYGDHIKAVKQVILA